MKQINSVYFTSEKTIFYFVIAVLTVQVPMGTIEVNTSFNYLPSKNGRGNFLAQDTLGFLYYKHHVTKDGSGSESWLCKNRRKHKCPVSIRIQGDLILWQRYEHNHKIEDVVY